MRGGASSREGHGHGRIIVGDWLSGSDVVVIVVERPSIRGGSSSGSSSTTPKNVATNPWIVRRSIPPNGIVDDDVECGGGRRGRRYARCRARRERDRE